MQIRKRDARAAARRHRQNRPDISQVLGEPRLGGAGRPGLEHFEQRRLVDAALLGEPRDRVVCKREGSHLPAVPLQARFFHQAMKVVKDYCHNQASVLIFDCNPRASLDILRVEVFYANQPHAAAS